MQKVQFSNDYHQFQHNALAWKSWKFDRAPTEYYFIQKSIPVIHVFFKIKSTEKHASIFDKVKPGPDRIQQFRILPTLFYNKVMWPQEKSFSSVLTITDKHKTSVLVKMCNKKYFGLVSRPTLVIDIFARFTSARLWNAPPVLVPYFIQFWFRLIPYFIQFWFHILFRIANKWDFDETVVDMFGCEVHCFDPR